MKMRLLKRDWELSRRGNVEYSLMPFGEKELDGGLTFVEIDGVPAVVDVDWWLKPDLFELLWTKTYKVVPPEMFVAARESNPVGMRRLDNVMTRFLDAMNRELRVLWTKRKPRLPRP